MQFVTIIFCYFIFCFPFSFFRSFFILLFLHYISSSFIHFSSVFLFFTFLLNFIISFNGPYCFLFIFIVHEIQDSPKNNRTQQKMAINFMSLRYQSPQGIFNFIFAVHPILQLFSAEAFLSSDWYIQIISNCIRKCTSSC